VADDELWKTLMRFHREVVKAEFREDIRTAIQTEVGSLRGEMLSHYDAVYKRFDRVETELDAVKIGLARIEAECKAIRASVERLEARVTTLDGSIDKAALRSELHELKERIALLEKQLN
jgi:predicted  nucleic acid-binding Zn-ribbon protein